MATHLNGGSSLPPTAALAAAIAGRVHGGATVAPSHAPPAGIALPSVGAASMMAPLGAAALPPAPLPAQPRPPSASTAPAAVMHGAPPALGAVPAATAGGPTAMPAQPSTAAPEPIIPGVPPGQLKINYQNRDYFVCPQAMHAKVPAFRPAWHSEDHKTHRRSLIGRIITLLQSKPTLGGRPEDYNPSALTFERGMYYGASSLEEYLDPTTLETRILLLLPFKRTIDEFQRTKQQQAAAMRAAVPAAVPPVPAPAMPYAPPVAQPAAPRAGVPAASSAQASAFSAVPLAQPAPGAAGQPGAGPAGARPAPATAAWAEVLANRVKQMIEKNAPAGAAPAGSAAAPAMPTSAPARPPGPQPTAGAPLTAVSDPNLRRQQSQRLMMLHHASRCTTAGCQERDCAALKVTLAHLTACTDKQSCTTRHCMSSRYCIDHYRACKDPHCDICVPVRQYVANSRRAEAVAASAAGGAHAGQKRNLEEANSSLGPGQSAAMMAPADVKKARLEALHAARPPGITKDQYEALPEDKKLEYQAAARRYQAMYQQYQQAYAAASTVAAPTVAKRKTGRLDGDCTLIATFTREQIVRHIAMLKEDFSPINSPEIIAHDVGPLLTKLMTAEYSWIFNTPVDPVKLKLPDYFDIIKKPLDLGTVKKRLDLRLYRTYNQFAEDIRLVWRNAMTYNPPGSEVHVLAFNMSEYFERDWQRVQEAANKRYHQATSDPDNCSLCGGGTFMFEPPTLYCNRCTQRIKKDAVYHATRSNKYHLCTTCFTELRRGGSGDMVIDGQVLPAKDFTKRKNTSNDEEGWVCCDNCNRWQHMICALYNQKRNEGSDIPHYCPHCINGHMQAKRSEVPIAKPVKGASDIPRSRLSDFIEDRLRIMLENHRQVLATEQEVDLPDVVMPQFTVRMVSCTDKVLLVNKEMCERYRKYHYPSQFNYRSKALMLWQKLGGVDVFLYGIYVQEYGDDCAEPNRRTAYLSYLDSVKYLQPSVIRTEVYHEILIAYLEDLKLRGFNQMTLWSCPPLRNDDYILYCLSEDHQILTNRGFMFLEDFEAYQGGDVLVAAYDAETGRLVYQPRAALIVNTEQEQELIEMTQVGATSGDAVSLAVTPEHDLLVRRGYIGREDAATDCSEVTWYDAIGHPGWGGYAKVQAGELLSGNEQEVVSMLAYAREGHDSPRTGPQMDAWLSSLELKQGPAEHAWLQIVGFALSPDARCRVVLVEDRPGLQLRGLCDSAHRTVRRLLEVAGLTEGADYHAAALAGEAQDGAICIIAPEWVSCLTDACDISASQLCKCAPAHVECGPHVHADVASPNRRLPAWVMRLDKARARCVLAGMCSACAHGGDSERSVEVTAPALRDDLVQLGLHAGYAASFSAVRNSELHAKGWRVCFSEAADAATPLLYQKRDLKRVHYIGRTWCVSVPHGFIVTRRTRVVDGVVVSASKPVIVGNCHPEEQRTPRPDRLREWYLRMVEMAQRRGIVEKVVFLLDDYFPSLIGQEGGGDRMLTQLPWCQGDYWPGLVPDYISQLAQESVAKGGPPEAPPVIDMPSAPTALEPLEPLSAAERDDDGDGDDGDETGAASEAGTAAGDAEGPPDGGTSDAPGQASNARKGKDRRGRGRAKGKARPRPGVARAGAVGGAAAAKKPAISVDGRLLPQDALRDKIFEQLARMPKDFIVVKLRPSCQFCKRYITGAPGMDRKYHCLACDKMEAPVLYHAPPPRKGQAGGHPTDAGPKRPGIAYDLCPDCFERERRAHESGARGLLQHVHHINNFVPVPVELAPGLRRPSHDALPGSSAPAASSLPAVPIDKLGPGGDAAGAMTDAARAAGLPGVIAAVPASAAAAGDPSHVDGAAGPAPDGVMIDPDLIINSPFFEYRENLLHLCQGNHYQFDQLRRAMHSSMMVLWHVHHPHAPSFVHSCNTCMNNITTGHRYTCSTCTDDFDLCENCYQADQKSEHPHPHKLTRHPVTGMGDEVAAQKQQQMKNQQEEWMKLMEHTCSDCVRFGTARCGNPDCERMILLLNHFKSCKLPRGSCDSCGKVTLLIRRHAQKCRFSNGECRVPDCTQFKEELRQANATAVSLDLRRRAATSAAKTGVRSDGARMGDDGGPAGEGETGAAGGEARSEGTAAAEAPEPSAGGEDRKADAAGSRLVASKGARTGAEAFMRGEGATGGVGGHAGTTSGARATLTPEQLQAMEERLQQQVDELQRNAAYKHEWDTLESKIQERYVDLLAENAVSKSVPFDRATWVPSRMDRFRIRYNTYREFHKRMEALRRRHENMVVEAMLNAPSAASPSAPSATTSDGVGGPASTPADSTAQAASSASAGAAGGDAAAVIPPASAARSAIMGAIGDAEEDADGGTGAQGAQDGTREPTSPASIGGAAQHAADGAVAQTAADMDTGDDPFGNIATGGDAAAPAAPPDMSAEGAFAGTPIEEVA